MQAMTAENLLERALDRIVEIAPVSHDREPAAGNQLAHRGDGLDRDDARSRWDQLLCELACSRRKVDDGGALTEIQAVDEVRDGRRRIARARAVVGRCAATEPLCPGMKAPRVQRS